MYRVMRHVFVVFVVVALGGCPGGNTSVGESCDRHGDCADGLQCLQDVCTPKCLRAPDCGDGYSCAGGICTPATKRHGDSCESEVDCERGLSCQIDGDRVVNGRLTASCLEQKVAAPAGDACVEDNECRNGTCALGRCVDLCRTTHDCAAGTHCMAIPRINAGRGAEGELFNGCFLTQGVATWQIPVHQPNSKIYFPVPSDALHASLVLSVPDGNAVGAYRVVAPDRTTVFQMCSDPENTTCPGSEFISQFFKNPVRHRRENSTAVLAMPSSPALADALQPGAYQVSLSSFTKDGGASSVIPRVTAIVRLGGAPFLDLHFHFLDLEDHPCQEAFGDATLDQSTAPSASPFQRDYLGPLRGIFESAGITIGMIDYTDIKGSPQLASIALSDADELLKLGKHAQGINVFFVRNLAPIGIQAYSPSPGPAGIGGTRRSGIIIGLDVLCYRDWKQLARLTAHEIARYMGLYRNVEISGQEDPIADSTPSDANLMFYSELGNTFLSPGQRDILLRSPALRWVVR